MRNRANAFLLLLVFGCTHDGPFRQSDQGTKQPFIPGPPRVLTANIGLDAYPAVLPGDSAYIYSFDSWYESGDMCLGLIPVGQARVTREFCPGHDLGSDDRFRLAAVSRHQDIAFLLTRSHPFGVGAYYSAIVIAPMADIRDTSDIIPVPVRTPDGILHDSISRLTRLGWLRGDTLAILLSRRIYLVATGDSRRTITWLDTPAPVVDFDVDGDALFVTLAGSSQLFQFDLDSRQVVPVHDFTGAGSIGLIQVAGPRALAVGGAGVYLADLNAHSQSVVNSFGRGIQQVALPKRGREMIAQSPDPFLGDVDLIAFRLP